MTAREDRLPLPESYAVACERVRCLCALYRASVTSSCRTRQRNQRVGGSINSKHQPMFGFMAWDLVPDQWTERRELANAARMLGFRVEVESDHVHLQALPPGPGSLPEPGAV